MYQLHIWKFFQSMDTELVEIHRAEKVRGFWRSFALFVGLSVLVYAWMGFVGIGSNLLLDDSFVMTPVKYESSKLWFLIGRILSGVVLAAVVVFLPAFVFRALLQVPLQKLLVMQLVVLAVVLVERLTWIPLAVYFGLDASVSPFSFGVLASLFTSKTWLIGFLSLITLFQLWIIYFQTKFLATFFGSYRKTIFVTVVLLHFILWWLVTLGQVVSPYIVGRWFG